MELLEAIRQRRAVRDYKPDAVKNADLRLLIEAATWAPSAMNEQPWRFVVVTDRALLETISRRSKNWLLDNGAVIARNEHLGAMLRDADFHIFHHAPALIAIAAADDVKWTIEGCALAAENLMLAATELGLGTCWIGLAQDWLNSAEGRQMLKLAPTDGVVAPIIVGHPKASIPPVPRKAPRVTWIGRGEAPMSEDGGESESDGQQGFYGTLIHP